MSLKEIIKNMEQGLTGTLENLVLIALQSIWEHLSHHDRQLNSTHEGLSTQIARTDDLNRKYTAEAIDAVRVSMQNAIDDVHAKATTAVEAIRTDMDHQLDLVATGLSNLTDKVQKLTLPTSPN